nr:MAG TPA: hypothetical protein [Caudoviricetes sp.]
MCNPYLTLCTTLLFLVLKLFFVEFFERPDDIQIGQLSLYNLLFCVSPHSQLHAVRQARDRRNELIYRQIENRRQIFRRERRFVELCRAEIFKNFRLDPDPVLTKERPLRRKHIHKLNKLHVLHVVTVLPIYAIALNPFTDIDKLARRHVLYKNKLIEIMIIPFNNLLHRSRFLLFCGLSDGFNLIVFYRFRRTPRGFLRARSRFYLNCFFHSDSFPSKNLRQGIYAKASGHRNTDTELFKRGVFLSEVSIIRASANVNGSIAASKELDRTIIASEYINLIVIQSLSGSAGLKNVLHTDHRPTMETSVIQAVVLVIFCHIRAGSNIINSNLSKGFLGTKNGNIFKLGFEIRTEIDQIILRIRTGLELGFIKIAVRAKLIERIENSCITILDLGIYSPIDKIIEIDSVGKNTIKLFIYTDAINIQSRRNGTDTIDSLSAQTASTLCYRIHNVTNIILYNKLHSITIRNIVIIYGIHEEFVILKTILASDSDYLLDLREHSRMITKRLFIQFRFAAVHGNELFSKNLLRIISGIVSLSATTFISIDGKLNKVFHICISPFVYFYKLQNANDIVGISTNSLNRFYSTDLLGTGSNGSHSIRLSASHCLDNRTNDYGITGCNSKSFLSYSINTAGMQTIATADLASIVGILRKIVFVLLRHFLYRSNEN